MKNNSLLKDEIPFTQFPSLYSVALTLSPYILLALTASWLSLSLYMLAARLLYFCWASVVWQLWDLKNELALALPASQDSQNISTSSCCPTPPPSCICLSCCHVQLVSRLVDLMKVRWTPRDLQSHSESHMSRVELSLSPVNPAAVDTDEDAVGDRSPGRVLCPAIKTHFVTLSRPESLEYLHDVSLGGSRHLHCVPGDL